MAKFTLCSLAFISGLNVLSVLGACLKCSLAFYFNIDTFLGLGSREGTAQTQGGKNELQ